MSKPLHNYLRTHRKRIGFTQKEIACLLNCRHGAAVSRYERRLRHPSLETMIALEIIYDAPIRQLYAGVFETVEQTVARQIDVMKKELTSCPTCDRIENQLVVLDNILKSINR